MNNISTPNRSSAQMQDVQGQEDGRALAIQQVGIKDIKQPLAIQDRDGQIQHTVANCCLYVDLAADKKGAHMSRLVELIQQPNRTLSCASFPKLLDEMRERLESQGASIELSFSYFRRKKAPESGIEGLIDYDVTLKGDLQANESRYVLRVLIPVTSLCPCSKTISSYGAHNQRSHVTLELQSDQVIWLDEIIDLVEAQASSAIFSVLKRVDEKFVTEQAYDNPKFVEDMVRDVAIQLNKDARIRAYTLETENFESIHNHSAYARIEYRRPE